MPDVLPTASTASLYGGLGAHDTQFEGVSDAIGRFWNTVSGRAASNQVEAREAELAWLRNETSAENNRNWETYMSNTAYQRAVADMKAAGLNPAAVGGDGASTPSSTPASAPAAHASSVPNGPGFLGMIAQIAKVAIGKALLAKFTNSALRAADNHQLVTAKVKALEGQEMRSAASFERAVKSSSKAQSLQDLANEEALRIRKAHDAKFGF